MPEKCKRYKNVVLVIMTEVNSRMCQWTFDDCFSESATTPNTTTSENNTTTTDSSVFVDTSPEIVIHPAPLPRPASHPLMSTPQTTHQGVLPCPTEVIGDDDVFDDSHQAEAPSTQASQDPTASDSVHPTFFL